jgi:chromosome partitioning protein
MKVLGLLSRKGGVGKTTLALHLAVTAQASGQRVLLVDLDPQGSASAWWKARDVATPELETTQPAQLGVLLDTARAAGITLAYLLVPTRPAILDLRAILGTLDIVKGGRHRASIVLNACHPPRGGIGESAATSDARKALKAFGVPVAPVSVVQRAALSHALVGGLAVSETDPGSKAAKEIAALWRHVEKEMNR